jgi:acylphosphatase
MEKTTLCRLHVSVEGRVQGVGFRNFVLSKADLLGLTGWVRNAGDNQVEVLAEGEIDQLTTFLEYLRKGPRSSFVMDITQSWDPATGEFQSFDIDYSV